MPVEVGGTSTLPFLSFSSPTVFSYPWGYVSVRVSDSGAMLYQPREFDSIILFAYLLCLQANFIQRVAQWVPVDCVYINTKARKVPPPLLFSHSHSLSEGRRQPP